MLVAATALTALTSGTSGGFPTATSPGPRHCGRSYFAGGPSGAASQGHQLDSLAADTKLIRAGRASYTLSGWLGGYSTDRASLHITWEPGSGLPTVRAAKLNRSFGFVTWRRSLANLDPMETWDAIRARRNVRTYEDRPIPAEHLEQILEAGWRSPSASNRQKWDFVLVTEPDQLRALSTVWVGASHLAGATAAIVLVLPEPESERYLLFDQYDLGQATMAMLLAATDLGIGSAHSAVGDQLACRQIIGNPADHTCAYMIALGYPGDRPLRPIKKLNRRPFDEVVHVGHW